MTDEVYLDKKTVKDESESLKSPSQRKLSSAIPYKAN